MHRNSRRNRERCRPERTELWRGQGDEPVRAEIPPAEEGKHGERATMVQR